MALNTLKCNRLTPLHFKGLNSVSVNCLKVHCFWVIIFSRLMVKVLYQSSHF